MENIENRKIALDTAKKFIAKKIAPAAGPMDENEEFSVENFKEMGPIGLLGITYPEQYGGAGFDYVIYSAVIEAIAEVCASTAMALIAHSTLTADPIFTYGTEEQKNNYLRPLLSGEKIGAFGLTEPNAGSDIAAMESVAVEKSDHFVLNGSKIFITNANLADIYVIAAKTAPEKGIMGISMFILERGMPGFTTSGKKEKKLGMRGCDTGELHFQDVIVPKGNLLGRRNFGFSILHNTLVCARIGMTATALGISAAAQKMCLKYVKQRTQFGKHLYHFQSIKNMLADMEISISAGRMMLRKAAFLKDAGEDFTKEASEAKLFTSEASMKITKDAIQIFGGYGYTREFPLERFFRDAKITEIGDGTSEMQRIIIADEIVKRTK